MVESISQNHILQPAVESFKNCIINNQIQQTADNQIIFLFGANPDINNESARDIFLKYSIKHLPQYRFLIAEKFFNCFSTDSIDLLTIEGELATYTDCVIIILESPGTYAELGAFAIHHDLSKKILTLNEVEHKDLSSFINLGPIAKINRVSKFGAVIHTNFKSILSSVSEIEERLKNNLRKYAKRIDLSTYKSFLSPQMKRYRLLILSDIISIFGPLYKGEITKIIKKIYQTDKYINIDFELSLLQSLGLIDIIDDLYFNAYRKEFLFYKYLKINISNIRFSVFNHYAKNSIKRLQSIADHGFNK